MTREEFVTIFMEMLNEDSPKINVILPYRLCTDREIQHFTEHCYEWFQTLLREAHAREMEKKMHTIRCKFKCESIMTQDGWDYEKKSQKLIYSAKFRPVFSRNPQHVNAKFWDATPVGLLEIGTVRQMPWEVGKEYYLDVSLAEDADPIIEEHL